MKVYRILHEKTRLFSKGGTSAEAEGRYGWSRDGKVWTTLGKLRSHINLHTPGPGRNGTDMSDWRVVEYRVEVDSVRPIAEVISPERLLKMLKNG